MGFLAEVTQHIPDAGEHLIRYYAWYSNMSRGQRAKTLPSAAAGTGLPGGSPTAQEARKGRAALVKQVCEAAPALVSQVWLQDEDHFFHRAAPGQGD
jgi:hypothetical protein